MIRDPDAPSGRGADGHPLTEEEYDKLYTNEDGTPRWPDNNGAVPGSEKTFTNPDEFAAEYGNNLDRVGKERGKFMAVVKDGEPASFESRSLPASHASEAYHQYVFDPAAVPEGYKIETSTAAGALGRDGGATQIRILDPEGADVSIRGLKNLGILR